jgi:hypothetical protein
MFEDPTQEEHDIATMEKERRMYLAVKDIEEAVEEFGADVVVAIIKSKYREYFLDALLDRLDSETD